MATIIASGLRRRANLNECLALRSAVWVTVQELTRYTSAGWSVGTKSKPADLNRAANVAVSAWFSLQPWVSIATDGRRTSMDGTLETAPS